MWRKVGVCVVFVTATLLCTAKCGEAVLHRVGGGQYTWSPSYNFTDWTIHQHFYVGDWLYFGFDKTVHNVLEVNKTSYEKCIDKDFISNVTRGGRDVFNLTEAREYYFLCGRGHCEKGMKVAVNVQTAPPTQSTAAATLPPQMAVSESTSNTHHLLFGFLWIYLFNHMY